MRGGQRRTTLVALLVALAFPFALGRPAGSNAPGDDELHGLAVSLAYRLQLITVDLPDGSKSVVVGSVAGGRGLLSREQVEICLRSVSLAEAWPAAWVVVQQKRRDFDLVMRVALGADGEVVTPDFVFTVPRREWEIEDIKTVVREVTGSKPPRQGIGHLVVQGFSTKIVESYVYEPAPTGEQAKGLARLLEPGSLIREATAIELQDGRRYTLALVLQDAVFEPSQCDDCAGELFGHADSGGIVLLLADDAAIVDRVDLGAEISGRDGRALLQRYRCEPQDRGAQPPIEAFAHREAVTLIELADLDGDGLALELALPDEAIDCSRHVALIARIDPAGPTLSVVGTREMEH